MEIPLWVFKSIFLLLMMGHQQLLWATCSHASPYLVVKKDSYTNYLNLSHAKLYQFLGVYGNKKLDSTLP